jgi:hypothetical protein
MHVSVQRVPGGWRWDVLTATEKVLPLVTSQPCSRASLSRYHGCSRPPPPPSLTPSPPFCPNNLGPAPARGVL